MSFLNDLTLGEYYKIVHSLGTLRQTDKGLIPSIWDEPNRKKQKRNKQSLERNTGFWPNIYCWQEKLQDPARVPDEFCIVPTWIRKVQ